MEVAVDFEAGDAEEEEDDEENVAMETAENVPEE